MLLQLAVEEGASDIHLRTDVPPRLRIDGQLMDIKLDNVTAEDLERVLAEVLPASRVEEFEATNDADFAFSAPAIGRFRVNAFRERGSVGVVFRRVRASVPSIEEMGLPQLSENWPTKPAV